MRFAVRCLNDVFSTHGAPSFRSRKCSWTAWRRSSSSVLAERDVRYCALTLTTLLRNVNRVPIRT